MPFFIIPTPIGNLKDITLRALVTLREVDFICCEDTRHSGKLLKHFEINRKLLIPINEYNEEKQIPKVLALLREGKSGALITDAGTPLLSDPGYKLIRAIINHSSNQFPASKTQPPVSSFQLQSLPGPSAITTALTVSGFPTDKFLFLGFPPQKEGKRQNFFKKLRLNKILDLPRGADPVSADRVTVVMFESPHRLLKCLKNLQEVFGEIDICICRELTKLHEEVRREKISVSIEHFEQTPPRGEFTLVFRNN